MITIFLFIDNAVDWLSGDMKARYCSMRLNKYTEERDPWPPIKTKSYVTLALVYQNELQTAQKTTATIYLRTKGDIHKISHTIEASKLTDIAQIFDPMSGRVPINIILIEGHAGIGKTTLVKQVCIEWAEGKLLISDKLVLLLLLRDPNVQRITNEQQLIEHFTKSISKVEQLHSYLEDEHGDGVTLIIDGFDELNTELRDYSFFRRLIEKRSLPKAKILVTSRPSASACLHQLVDKRIEILGFEQSSKNQYVTEALQDSPSKLEKLQKHFQQHPNIDAICYIPLIMSIIVFLCICQPDELPPTATNMYASFIFHTICHYLKRVGQFPKDKIINELKQFPRKIYLTLQKLEKTAFDGLVRDKIVFTVEELPVVCKDDPTCYGLLQSSECYGAEESGTLTKTFNFLHLGIQEYFAAKYVTTLPKKKVYLLLKESFIVTDEYKLFNLTVRLSNMWILYCGITSGQCKTLRHYLRTYGDQRISTSEIISQHVLKDQSNVLYLFQCFQEAQDIVMCKVLSKSFDSGVIDISEHSLLPHQVVSLGYFLSKFDHKKLKELNLSNCRLGDHGMSILHKYLCRDKANKQEIIKVDLSRNSLTEVSSPLIAEIISHLQMHTLLLQNNKITNVRDISTAVINSSTLKVLDLDDNYITAQEAVTIYDMMICLEELYISSKKLYNDNYHEASNKLGDLGAELLSKRITNTKTLRVLHINIVGLSGITAITNALVSNSSLENLNLNNDDKLAMRIVRSPHHNTITKVELPNMPKSYDDVIDISGHKLLPPKVVSLGFFLSKSHQTKWKKLSLSKCCIGDHRMSILHQYFCGDKTNKLEITEINLSENNLTGASSPLIADIISHLQVHTLLLHGNSITNVRDISTAIITSSTLKVLDLDDNDITAQEAVAIYDMMICLEELYISSKKLYIDHKASNKLGDLGAELLSKRITNTKTLRVLHINIVGLSGITAIINALVGNSSLENLNLNNDDKLAMRIVRSPHLNTITKVELLKFHGNVINISEYGLLPYQVVSLGFFLSKSHQRKWKKLSLSKCRIGDHGMSILHQYLCGDKTNITELNLSENNLTGASSPLIADIISHLEIHTLLLHDNNITNVRDISTAVINSSTLKVLDLDNNGITAQEAVAIYDMMICLEELYISSKKLYIDHKAGNKLGDLGAELLSKRITNTKTLRVLHINIVGLSGITAITNALVSNSSLENLNLNNDDKLAMKIVRSPHLNTITKVEVPNILKSYDNVIDISGYGLLPHQVVSLGFFLSKSHQRKWKKLNLSKCRIGDHGMSILHQYLCKDKASKLEMLEINLNENDLTGASSSLIADIISHLQIHTLLLCNNNITNVRDISSAVINSSTLKVLDLDDNGITAQEAVAISDMMISLEELHISSKLYNRKLNINYSTNKLGDCGAELLSEGITNTKTLRVLHIAGNNIGPSGTTAIVNALVNNTSLEELNLNNNNKVGKDGAIVIAKAITNNKTLKILLLNNFYTMDEEESAMIILMSLQHNNTITRVEFADISVSFDYAVIDISAHSLLPPQVEFLGLFLSQHHHRKWKEFNLSTCHIGDHGMSILHKYLCGNKTSKLEIIEINLSENNLTGASSPLIADIITRLQVHVLWLHNNDITNVRDISTAVITSSTLKVLSLNGNYITAQEVVAISDMMTCLEELYISNNRLNRKLNTSDNETFGKLSKGIGDRGAELLSKGITNTKSLRVLHIADSNIGPSGVIAIANALVNNTSLEELNMNHNNIFGQDGAEAIAKAITNNKTLKKLLLYGDFRMNYDEAMMIRRSLDHNNTIIKLDLRI